MKIHRFIYGPGVNQDNPYSCASNLMIGQKEFYQQEKRLNHVTGQEEWYVPADAKPDLAELTAFIQKYFPDDWDYSGIWFALVDIEQDKLQRSWGDEGSDAQTTTCREFNSIYRAVLDAQGSVSGERTTVLAYAEPKSGWGTEYNSVWRNSMRRAGRLLRQGAPRKIVGAPSLYHLNMYRLRGTLDKALREIAALSQSQIPVLWPKTTYDATGKLGPERWLTDEELERDIQDVGERFEETAFWCYCPTPGDARIATTMASIAETVAKGVEVGT